MAAKILYQKDDRGYIQYIPAPAKSGKTSSVLPAFLESTGIENGGTHYLYIAFSNNNKRSISCESGDISNSKLKAEKQGASFMVECIKILLEQPDDLDAYKINLQKEILKKS